MEIIGHRGARGLAPENTLPSIKRAMTAKVAMIEVDIRVKDDALVLSHDPIDETKTYTALTDALHLINGKVPLNIELKDIHSLRFLHKTLKGYKGKILFSSFQYKILHELKKIMPKADIAVLEKWSAVRGISEARMLNTKRVHFNQQWLWSRLVQSLKHNGYTVYAYTVNSRDRAEELEAWGVDGIFTDYPSLFR